MGLSLLAGAAMGGDLLWLGESGESPVVVLAEPAEPDPRSSFERMHADLSRFPLRRPVAFAVGAAADRIPQPFVRIRWVPSETVRGTRLEFDRAPGWLVHQALGAGAAVGVVPEVPSLRRQAARALVRRTGEGSGVEVPTLGVAAAVARPAAAERLVVATVRRMEGLAGRPRDDRRYLVAAGRVWIARDLYWIGLVLWVVLLVVDRPGAWRRRRSAERVNAGRRYLGGAVFRLLFLLAFLWAPTAAALMLYPAAALAAMRPWIDRPGARAIAAAMTLTLPVVGIATASGLPDPLDAIRVALVAGAALAAATRWLLPLQARKDSQRSR